MQPLRAAGSEPAGERERVILEGADVVEPALTKPYRPAVEEVDGGEY